jgi:hypothetical protein
MIYVVVGIVISVIVSVLYIGSIWSAFRRVKEESQQSLRKETASEELSQLEQERVFSWKALASIVLSSLILFLIGKYPIVWNLVPFITIGTSVAIIAAFALEFRGYGRKQGKDVYR